MFNNTAFASGRGPQDWLGDQNPQLIARNLAFYRLRSRTSRSCLKNVRALRRLTRNRDAIAATQETLQAQTERQRLGQRLADQRENQRQILVKSMLG